MGKSIKKAIRVFALLLLIFLLLPVILAGLLLINPVQNQVVDWAAQLASKHLQSEITIGSIYIEPFTTLRIDEILIRDVYEDTLLYSEQLYLELAHFERDPMLMDLAQLKLRKGYFNLHTVEGDSISNLQYLIDKFPKSSSDTSETSFELHAASLALDSMRFRLDDDNHPLDSSGGIDFKHLYIRDLCGRIQDIGVVGDSISASVYGLSCSEQSGLIIRHFTSLARVSDGMVQADQLQLVTNKGVVRGQLSLKANSWNDYGQFVDSVDLNASLSNSKIFFSLFDTLLDLQLLLHRVFLV